MKDKSVRPHQKLEAWKKAMALAERVYLATADFPKCELFGLTARIRESATAIPGSIADGSAREASEEYMEFVYDARASLSKLETLLLLARRLKYIPPHSTVFSDMDEVSRLLSGLINHLKRLTETT